MTAPAACHTLLTQPQRQHLATLLPIPQNRKRTTHTLTKPREQTGVACCVEPPTTIKPLRFDSTGHYIYAVVNFAVLIHCSFPFIDADVMHNSPETPQAYVDDTATADVGSAYVADIVCQSMYKWATVALTITYSNRFFICLLHCFHAVTVIATITAATLRLETTCRRSMLKDVTLVSK